MLTRQRQLEEMKKLEVLQRGAEWKEVAQLLWGSVRTFYVMFLSGFVGFGKAGC